MDSSKSQITPIWTLDRGDSPIVATAIHAGHVVREDVAAFLRLSEEERLHEEDPFTNLWTRCAPNRLIGTRSRFQIDLNRSREKAIYRVPGDAWGLRVWNDPAGPPPDVAERSLAEYDAFYADARRLFSDLELRFGRFIVLDLHSYNHRRLGPKGPSSDPETNPEVNVGTGTMSSEQRRHWALVIDSFIAGMKNADFSRRRLDVRENVKFQGGQFSRWIHQTFPSSGCALAVEFKKFFMDEWTGVPNSELVDRIGAGLRALVPDLMDALTSIQGGPLS